MKKHKCYFDKDSKCPEMDTNPIIDFFVGSAIGACIVSAIIVFTVIALTILNLISWDVSFNGSENSHSCPDALIMTSKENVTKDHGHPVATNPTVFIHEFSEFEEDTKKYMSFEYDETGELITVRDGLENNRIIFKGTWDEWRESLLKASNFLEKIADQYKHEL